MSCAAGTELTKRSFCPTSDPACRRRPSPSPAPTGNPWIRNHVTRTFAKLVRQAGLPHVRLHELRHTHATLLFKAGVHPKIVSERLGHASIAITLDTYSHVLPGLQEAAAERFDRMLEGIGSRSDGDPDVSRMLADGEQSKSEAPGTRTRNRPIKSQLLYLLS